MRFLSFLCLNRRYWSLGLILLVGTGISSLVFQIKREAVSDRQRATLAEASPQYVRLLQWEIDVHVDALTTLRDLVQATPAVDRARFTSSSEESFQRAYALRSLHWVPIVPGAEREAFEARTREAGLADFYISETDEAGGSVPARTAEEHYPVYFSESQEPEWKSPGFDLGSNPRLEKSLRHAAAERRLVVFPDRGLDQTAVSELTVLLLLPVLAAGEETREVTGLVVARVDLGLLCRRVLGARADGLAMELCDFGEGEEGKGFRFSTDKVSADDGRTRFEAPIFVGNGYWTLSIVAGASRAGFWGTQAESLSVLGIGLAFTCFLALWMRQRQMYVESVESEVSDRTAALSRINKDLENEMAQRRVAETNLAQSETRFREAFLHAPIGIGLMSPTGDWMQVNEALVRMSGFSAEELQRLTMAEMLHPDEVHQELAQMGQIMAGEIETFALEQRFRHKSGRFIWVLMNVSQVRGEDRALLYFVCQILDITERKEALEETRRAQRFSENIIKSSIDGILSFDRTSCFTVWNHGMERMTGIASKDALGRPAAEVLPFLGEYEKEEQAFRRVLIGEEVKSTERPFSVPSSGRSGFYTAHLSPLQGDDGGIIGGVAIVHDVSVERRARERLQASTELLKQRNRELQDFAYVASHDLQEPLRKIRAFGDRLEKKCDGQLDDQAQDCLKRMMDAARRMQTLISDLLAFSRVSTEVSPLAPVDLAVVLREVLSDLETRIEETSALLEIGALPTIECDATQMRQLFQNLISNGLKYHRPDTACRIRIYATDFSDTGDLPALAGPGFLIHFEDTGIGFDEKYLDRIFTVFQRLHGRNDYPGTGVGLAICRRIVERHHGWITARSAPGKGATFIVALPGKQPTIHA